MTPKALTLTLLGFGIGVLIVGSASRGLSRGGVWTLRDRAIEAQRFSARASSRARELAALYSAEQDRLAKESAP